MHKLILNLFGFLKNCIQFIKILVLFAMLMLLLYWIQNLTGDFWAWSSFMNSFFNFLLDVGQSIMPGSIMLFAAVFEFKYLVALGLLIAIYALAHFGYIALCTGEDIYGNSRQLVKKIEENCFNKTLEMQNTYAQKKIQRFQIYIGTQIKSKFVNKNYKIDLDEQNKILIKHLVSKLETMPEKFEDGFLFTFNSFSQIDGILDVFAKLLESQAPIDYIICIQILGNDKQHDISQLKILEKLKHINKITALPDTVYRYSFNDIQNFETIPIGLFQKDGGQFEVHEFIKKD